MCAPGRVGARASSINFAIALPDTVSSRMNTCHSVVLRCSVQYRFGYESTAYRGVVSRGIIYAGVM